MKTIAVLFACIAGSLALTNPPITGETPPPIDCPNTLCQGKSDGNFKINGHKSYFVQCTAGNAACQACWPQDLVFSQRCNQCLYNEYDDCYTTASWVPEKRFKCPDICPGKGKDWNGNMADPDQPRHYVGCWQGVTMGCVNCPAGLLFNEVENACLYEGKFLTQPDYN